MNYTLTLTSGALKDLNFISEDYTWAEIILNNSQGNILTLSNMAAHEIMEAIKNEGLPSLNPNTALFKFMWSFIALIN